jgi:ribosomal protein S18 acetylase RimI-like enzyme
MRSRRRWLAGSKPSVPIPDGRRGWFLTHSPSRLIRGSGHRATCVTTIVRPARPRDVEDVVEIGLVSWREGFRGVVPRGLMPDEAGLRARIRERVAERGPPIAVAELDGRVRGWITFGPSRDAGAGPSIGEIWALNVHPDAWRRGLGRELVGYALDRLARDRFAEATLWTFRDTRRSRSFYESLGFEHDGATQLRQASGGAIEVRYRMPLGRAAPR